MLDDPEILASGITITNSEEEFNGFGVQCADNENGIIDLEITGGVEPYQYTWSNDEETQDISNLTPGWYVVDVTDANGCEVTDSIEIIAPTELILTADFEEFNGFGVECEGDQDAIITTLVSGGVQPYTWNWSTGDTSQDLENIGAGTYTITVTDDNGCQKDTTLVIIEPDNGVSVTGETSQADAGPYQISCFEGNDGSISIVASGGTEVYSYLWNTGDTVPTITGPECWNI